MKKLFFIFFLTFLVMESPHARLFLNVSIINKKGIDIGLVLGSELHSIEEVRHDEDIMLEMRSGIKVFLNASFQPLLVKDEDALIYGPSALISVKGRILDSKNQILKDFTKEPLIISLEDEKNLIYSQESQLIELKITPRLK